CRAHTAPRLCQPGGLQGLLHADGRRHQSVARREPGARVEEMIALYPSPRLRGEGAERALAREADEGQSPITRSPSPGALRAPPSPRFAGRGKERAERT